MTEGVTPLYLFSFYYHDIFSFPMAMRVKGSDVATDFKLTL
jgi:hypothetical protein